MQQGINTMWIALSVTFMIVAILFFLPLFGDFSKAFTYINSDHQPYVETTEIPVPIGVPSSEVIATLQDIALQDYVIEVNQSDGTYVFANDVHIANYLNNIDRNRTFNKEITRNTGGEIQKIIYMEITN